MRLSMLLLVLLLSVPTLVFAWGDLGHRAISEAVQANLEPATVKAIAKIVGQGDELPVGVLARLSIWPDQIRPLTKNLGAFLSGFTREELLEARRSCELIRTIRNGIMSICRSARRTIPTRVTAIPTTRCCPLPRA